jgi:hypothetical protein
LKLSMEQSFENENTYDVFINENKDGSWAFAKTWKNASVQIEGSRNPKNNEETMKEFWKKYIHKKNILETK